MWVCEHVITDPETADAMSSWYATSPDGLVWTIDQQCLAPLADGWDSRGARIAAVLGSNGSRVAYYDGRATFEENWEERTGWPPPTAPASSPRSVTHRPRRHRTGSAASAT